MTPPRLSSLETAGEPIVVMYGEAVDDLFVGAGYRAVRIDEALCDVLLAEGFERVVFSGAKWNVYFLDERSRTLSRPRTAAPARPRRMTSGLTGPMGGGIIADFGAAAEPSQSMGDEAAVRLMDAFMKETGPRTALVFLEAEEWLRHGRATRSAAAALSGWIGGGGGHLVVMLFKHQSLLAVQDSVATMSGFPRLESHLVRLREQGRRGAFAIGPPDAAELGRLAHLMRLRSGLALADQRELPRLARDMASARLPLRVWENRLARMAAEGTALGRDLLRERGWVARSGHGDASPWERLERMPGLAPVKQHLRRLHARLTAERALRERGRGGPGHDSPHLVFTGNPGTGKTTVAELVGEMYRDLGLLPSGHLVQAELATIVSRYVGNTAHEVTARVEEARGGVLFIDEAYRLVQQRQGYGQEAIDTLVSLLESGREDFVAVLAGYPEPMERLLAANPGLRSRFPRANVIEFPDYEPGELLAILLGMLTDRGLTWTPEAESRLRGVVTRRREEAGADFGNARDMRNLAQELYDSWAEGGDPDRPLDPSHFAGLSPEEVQAEPPTAEQLLGELDGMVGLSGVREMIGDLYQVLALRRRRQAGDGVVAPHLLFVGPPGTGKTTVARVVGRVFASLGLLRTGAVVEVARADLVGEYLGQTALKVRDAVRSALGGVLFVDEAYSLSESRGHDQYGQEAITALVKEMEDHRGDLVVIAAGYPREMDDFLAANPGLRSRFGERVEFPGYTAGELAEILRLRAADQGYTLTAAAVEKAADWLAAERAAGGATFGNARAVRKLLERLEAGLARRTANGAHDLSTITPEDVPHAR
ncbi:AAA family ATPase [Nonomuraea insulae]|uniref:AAA family ATPase n=1 Tax=Nonomuraea insulae TaxID=1616787 RepID=A0ABW1CCD4_9ACTN